jgi:hypothetical protein
LKAPASPRAARGIAKKDQFNESGIEQAVRLKFGSVN